MFHCVGCKCDYEVLQYEVVKARKCVIGGRCSRMDRFQKCPRNMHVTVALVIVIDSNFVGSPSWISADTVTSFLDPPSSITI